MEIHYKIIGILLILLAGLHLIFPGYFKWKEELGGLSLVNRQMMVIHTFFIALMLLLMGLLCLTASADLIHTKLGKTIALGFGIFWAIRLYIQFFGYSSALWKGKKFETAVHIFFSFLWVYLSSVFLITALA